MTNIVLRSLLWPAGCSVKMFISYLNLTQVTGFKNNTNTNEDTQEVSQSLTPVKRICVFEHSVMTNFNCAYPTIQRGQGSGFLSEVPLDSLLVWASSEGSGETARMRRLAWTFAARIGNKYKIRLTRSICSLSLARKGSVNKLCHIQCI